MINKIENANIEYFQNIYKVDNIIKTNSKFLFYFSPDPDAIGASLALALYIKKYEGKECFLILMNELDSNLHFLLEIASYNNIIVINEIDKVLSIMKISEFCIIICDTPTHHQLEKFNLINPVISQKATSIIEIDHHFGGDSEKIYLNSISLFKKSNSCCEIIADFLEQLGKDNGNINEQFPRNIALSLIVGISFDTQLGKFTIDNDRYSKWIKFLTKILNSSTFSSKSKLKSSKQIYHAISVISKKKQQLLNEIIKDIDISNKVGLVILPNYEKYEKISIGSNLVFTLNDLIQDLSNQIPEVSGHIGIFAYYDTVQKLFLIKIRRALGFKKVDLRNLDVLLKKIFDNNFINGGGHEGATSFRIADIGMEMFIKKVKEFHSTLAESIIL